MASKRRVGIVGFGHIGQFLYDKILAHDDLDVAFVWNRTVSAMDGKVEKELILEDLSQFAARNPDLIVEVAHPVVSAQFGEAFLQEADYMVGSPTALADQATEDKLRAAAVSHGIYVPSGAFWGGEDIKKMADRGTLQALKVSMRFHPHSFRLQGHLKEKNEKVDKDHVVLYEGPVRDLCPLAPNNVNTMAAACMAAHNLGFDKVTGSLLADPSLNDWHVVEVEAWGQGDIAKDRAFHVHTVRRNPAVVGAVTGKATYLSFFSSLLHAKGKGPGVHLC